MAAAQGAVTSENPVAEVPEPSSLAPYITVVMPVYETPEDLLRRSIWSVLRQTMREFELIVVDDGSTSTEVAEVLEDLAGRDARLRVLRLPVNSGIVAASNAGLEEARGEFVALVDHDDILERRALEICAEVLRTNPECDLLYTDEDWVDMDDVVLGPFLKPNWSPERLRAQMYVNHLSLYRRDLIVRLGGFRHGFDGSQDYDLVLRVSEQARQIVHLPKILYHWRVRPGQVSGTGNPAVYDAARRAITEHCSRLDIPGYVEQIDPLGIYRIRRPVRGEPLVSIVVPTRGSKGTVWGKERTFVVEALRSIVDESSYPNVEFIVVADEVTPASVIESLSELCGKRLRLVWYDRPFNYSHKMNFGRRVGER